MQIEPILDLSLGNTHRVLSDIAALIEDAIWHHQCWHRHVQIEPHIARLLLTSPQKDKIGSWSMGA